MMQSIDDSAELLFHICYEDGDEEDLDLGELENLVTAKRVKLVRKNFDSCRSRELALPEQKWPGCFITQPLNRTFAYTHHGYIYTIPVAPPDTPH